MSRRGAIRVGEYRQKLTGVVGEIFYDKGNNTHFAHVLGEKIEEAAFDAAHARVKKTLDAAASVQWIAVLQIRVSEDDRGGEDREQFGMVLEYSRYFAARRGNGQALRSPWAVTDLSQRVRYEGLEVPPDLRNTHISEGYHLHDVPFEKKLPFRVPEDGTMYFAYNEATYRALVELDAQLQRLRNAVKGLIETDDGLVRLVSGLSLPTLPTLTDGGQPGPRARRVRNRADQTLAEGTGPRRSPRRP